MSAFERVKNDNFDFQVSVFPGDNHITMCCLHLVIIIIVIIFVVVLSLRLCYLHFLVHSQTDEYGFVRPDDFDYVEYEKFMSVYLNLLTNYSMKWVRLLLNNSQMKRNAKLKKFVRTGIPLVLRAPVSYTSIYII